jgi:hypothetical protein
VPVNVTSPQDAEWLMAQEVQAACGIRCTATDEAEQERDPHAQFVQTGCTTSGEVAWLHTMSIDVWAGESPDYAAAWDAALKVSGALAKIGIDSAHGFRAVEITTYTKTRPRRTQTCRA